MAENDQLGKLLAKKYPPPYNAFAYRNQERKVNAFEVLSELPAETVKAFLEFTRKSPAIWGAFQRFAIEAAAAGRKYYGAKMIMERVRWETEVTKGGEFKINNDYTAYYARLFAAKWPEYPLFSFRKVTGLKRAA